MNNPTVLVLGANGRFGAAAVQAFAAAGWTVLAQARKAPAALPAGARHLVVDLAVDLADTAALARAAAGARAVVYAVNPPYTQWHTQALPLARLGMDCAAVLGARFMLPGNVYNFGDSMPALLDEDTPQRPSTDKGRLRCDLEAELAARAGERAESRAENRAAPLRSIVIRAGDFFGAGSGSWLDLVLAKSLAQGKLAYPGPLEVPHAWAYLPDLARAFVAAAARDDLPAATTLHFAGHTLTGAEMLAAVECAARSLGIAPAGGFRRAGMPWGLIRAGGLFVPMWRELARMAYLWDVPHALDGRRLARMLGPQATTDIDSALRQSLQLLGLAGADMRPQAAAA